MPIFFWPRKSQLFLEGSYKLQNRLTSNHCGAYIHACPTRFLAQKTSDILGKRNIASCLCTSVCTNLQSFYSYLLGGKLRKVARLNSEISLNSFHLALTYRGTKPFPMYSKLQLCSFVPFQRDCDGTFVTLNCPRSPPARCSREAACVRGLSPAALSHGRRHLPTPRRRPPHRHP